MTQKSRLELHDAGCRVQSPHPIYQLECLPRPESLEQPASRRAREPRHTSDHFVTVSLRSVLVAAVRLMVGRNLVARPYNLVNASLMVGQTGDDHGNTLLS